MHKNHHTCQISTLVIYRSNMHIVVFLWHICCSLSRLGRDSAREQQEKRTLTALTQIWYCLEKITTTVFYSVVSLECSGPRKFVNIQSTNVVIRTAYRRPSDDLCLLLLTGLVSAPVPTHQPFFPQLRPPSLISLTLPLNLQGWTFYTGKTSSVGVVS